MIKSKKKYCFKCGSPGNLKYKVHSFTYYLNNGWDGLTLKNPCPNKEYHFFHPHCIKNILKLKVKK